MRFATTVGIASAFQAMGCLASTIRPRQTNQPLHTWWHDKSRVNEDGAVAADEVRQSRKYNISVTIAGQNKLQDSFVYEAVPRNGNGKMFDPANPGQEYDLEDGYGITVEVDAGINMAWTQFEYAEDVEVHITSKDGSDLGPASNVIIRPSDTQYKITSPDASTVIIHVPHDDIGRRFSVEFQNDLYAYRSNGSSYVSDGDLLVSEEPRNALLVFASPFLSEDLIPAKTSPDTQVLKPGKIEDTTIGSQPTVYFEAGIYWVEKDGYLGKSHIKLDPNTNYVYFEPGTYIKGAFEYTTSKDDFYTIGHAVVSGENYAYMANTA